MLVTIITEDEFGQTVARILGKQFEVEPISLKQGLARDWQKDEPGLVAVCTDRPYIAAFEKLSDNLSRANRPLTFACIGDGELSIGPLLIPGKSACYRCYQRRKLAHTSSSIKIQRVVRAAFDRDWSLKSPGMLPTTPVMAAARLARHALLLESDFGQVTQVSLTGFLTQEYRVHRVHGCGCLPAAQTVDLTAIVEKLYS